MSRVQLALNVTDVDAAVDFYSKLFAHRPAKRKPGYANFEIADPPLKLVLIEGPEGGTLNHLGVETESADEVVAAEARLSETGPRDDRRRRHGLLLRRRRPRPGSPTPTAPSGSGT